MESIIIRTKKSQEIINLTTKINLFLSEQQKAHGSCTIFIPHTTACITLGEIGEGTDQDFLEVMRSIIPKISFRHAHDPSHAWTHMASSIVGQSISVPFSDKKLLLGTWQSVMFVEFDGPRERTVHISSNE